MLDKVARGRLRTLSKDNAEDVARHLVMAGNLLENDPELAYNYAQVALARGGRVDIVREAAAITAYATGRYAEALREFRTVRRLNGSSEHVPLMADCERGLGRPERALAIAAEPESAQLSPYAKAELAIVVAGARGDLGDADAALTTLQAIKATTIEQRDRIAEAKADALDRLGRADEARELRARIPAPEPEPEVEEDVVVYDLVDEATELDGGAAPAGSSAESPDASTRAYEPEVED